MSRRYGSAQTQDYHQVIQVFDDIRGNLNDNPPTDIIPSIDGAPSVTLEDVNDRLTDVETMVDVTNRTIKADQISALTPGGTINVQSDITIDSNQRFDVTNMRLLGDVSAGMVVLAKDTGGTLGYGVSGGAGGGGDVVSADFTNLSGIVQSNVTNITNLTTWHTTLSAWHVTLSSYVQSIPVVDICAELVEINTDVAEISGRIHQISGFNIVVLSGLVYDLSAMVSSLSGYMLIQAISGLSDLSARFQNHVDDFSTLSGHTYSLSADVYTYHDSFVDLSRHTYSLSSDVYTQHASFVNLSGHTYSLSSDVYSQHASFVNLSGRVYGLSAALYDISSRFGITDTELSGLIWDLSAITDDHWVDFIDLSSRVGSLSTGFATLSDYVYSAGGGFDVSAQGAKIGLSNGLANVENIWRLDNFLHKDFLLPPPVATVSEVTQTGVLTTVDQTAPEQIELGFLDILVPQIQAWRLDVSLGVSPQTQVFSNDIDMCTNSIVFVAFDSNNNQSGTVYTITDLSQSATQSVRLAGVNQNTGDPLNWLAFDVSFSSSVGVPSAPRSLALSGTGTNTVAAAWLAPLDNDIDTPGNNTVPPISAQYVWVTETGDSTSIYGGRDVSASTSTATTSASLTSSQLPQAGTGYRVEVAARNTLNASYGEGISDEVQTSEPTNLQSAPWTGGVAISTASTMSTQSGTAQDMSGVTAQSRVQNWASSGTHKVRLAPNNTLNPLGQARFIDLSSRYVVTAGGRSLSGFEFRVRESNSAGVSDALVRRAGVLTLSDYVGSETDVAFQSPVVETSGAWGSVGVTTAWSDQYATTATVGFWGKSRWYGEMDLDTKASALGSLVGQREYALRLEHEYLSGVTSIASNTSQQSQALDDLDSMPSVVWNKIVDISAVTGAGISQVTGVPGVDSNATFQHTVGVSGLGQQQLRSNGLHVEQWLEASEANDVSRSLVQRVARAISGVSPPANATVVPTDVSQRDFSGGLLNGGVVLPVDGEPAQFHAVTSSLTSNVLWSEGVRGNARAMNLVGTTDYVNGLTLSGGSVRTDSISLAALGTLCGTMVVAGTGEYPDYGTASGEFGGSQNHAVRIIDGSDTRYAEQLQMAGGLFWAVAAGRANTIAAQQDQTVSEQYYEGGGTVSGGDQSVIDTSSTSWRYVTFRQPAAITSNTQRVTLTMTASGMSSQNDSDHRLAIRTVSNEAEETGWLDATELINPALDLTVNKDTNGLGVLNLDTASTGTVRQCDFPVTVGGDLQVRVGFRNDSSTKTVANVAVTVTNS